MTRLLVTVGTTEFNPLVQALCKPEVLVTLRSQGVTDILYQVGRSTVGLPAEVRRAEEAEDVDWHEVQLLNFDKFGLRRLYFHMTPHLLALIAEADFVISHCGAGTLIECLKFGKRVCAVSNTKLANNHQIELGEELARRNLIHFVNGTSLENDSQLNDRLVTFLSSSNPVETLDLKESMEKASAQFRATIASLIDFNIFT